MMFNETIQRAREEPTVNLAAAEDRNQSGGSASESNRPIPLAKDSTALKAVAFYL